ncbi:hypothetical protein EZV62_012786 [Acer yangbiense]|uniref:HAT C-terminal dimerisation domain-containing protein n=1 Tax=Acer yangbiense TaxID=1000413 RepID=A0A5C7HWC2_9ROSI|nr:hypothetical protein EZV62_012786 [Acer yangbiense]
MQRIVEEAELKVKQSLPRSVPLPTTVGSSFTSASYGLDPKKRKGVSGAIEKAFNIGAREQLDGEIARMFYTGGLPFHFARNPHYVNAFKSACSNPIMGYLPPGYNSLRITLLQKEKANIVRLLDPIKATWEIKGAVNCEGEFKDKYSSANLLIESIREIGQQNVVQVITDNAANFRTLNLALKNICSPLAHPKYDVMEVCGWIPKLLTVADSRFAFTIVMLKRFKEIKQALQHMVISEKWDMYKEYDVEKARTVKEKYYRKQWLQEVPGRVPPHQDFEITRERKKCIERYFPNVTERRKVNEEFANFSMFLEDFVGSDSMDDRSFMSPEKWWAIHGNSIKTLQGIAFKLLGQPCSSSCCERNWSTYNFIHSMRRNKITPQRAEDLFSNTIEIIAIQRACHLCMSKTSLSLKKIVIVSDSSVLGSTTMA